MSVRVNSVLMLTRQLNCWVVIRQGTCTLRAHPIVLFRDVKPVCIRVMLILDCAPEETHPECVMKPRTTEDPISSTVVTVWSSQA